MTDLEELTSTISGLLSDALELLSDCIDSADATRKPDFAQIAADLAMAKQRVLAKPLVIDIKRDLQLESADERAERKAEETAKNVQMMLARLQFSDAEQLFCKELGERLVDFAADEYVSAIEKSKGYQGACITAAVAVALMIVHDSPDRQC